MSEPIAHVGQALERLDADAIRLARQLRHAGRRCVGLLPAGETTVVWPVALQLGLALERVTGEPVAVVDADLSWPELEAGAGAATPGEDGLSWSQRLVGALDLFAPMERPPPGARSHQLVLLLGRIAAAPSGYTHVIVDLTCFRERPGEFLAMLEVVEGVVIVARAGATRAREVTALEGSMPRTLDLGVLLVR